MGVVDRVNQGWAAHADDPEGVLASLAGAEDEAADTRELAILANLCVHVLGEHLGRYLDAVDRVARIRAAAAHDPTDAWAASIWRGTAAMHRCAGDLPSADRALVAAGGDAAQRIRAWMVAAPALASQGGDPGPVLDEALVLGAALGPGPKHAASKALAMGANNVAAALEQRADRTPADTATMKRAAAAARRWWAVCGDWTNVRIAEYRLAMTHLAAGEPAVAEAHARAALALVAANDGGPSDRFFAQLALAEATAAQGGSPAALLAEAEAAVPAFGDHQDWAAAELAAARARIG